jgi:hypothetical protein
MKMSKVAMDSSDEYCERVRRAASGRPVKNKIMAVDFINGYGSEIPIRQTTTPRTPAAPAAPTDSFDASTQLSASVNSPAQSRPEKIAHAQALLSDGKYPSDLVLNQLAGFLAGKI